MGSYAESYLFGIGRCVMCDYDFLPVAHSYAFVSALMSPGTFAIGIFTDSAIPYSGSGLLGHSSTVIMSASISSVYSTVI